MQLQCSEILIYSICFLGNLSLYVSSVPHPSFILQVKNEVQVQTFASSTFSSFLDVLLSCFFFLALTLACFLPPLVSPATVGPPAPAALALAPLAGLLELASLVLSIRWGGLVRQEMDFAFVGLLLCRSVHTSYVSESFQTDILIQDINCFETGRGLIVFSVGFISAAAAFGWNKSLHLLNHSGAVWETTLRPPCSSVTLCWDQNKLFYERPCSDSTGSCQVVLCKTSIGTLDMLVPGIVPHLHTNGLDFPVFDCNRCVFFILWCVFLIGVNAPWWRVF